MIATKAAWRNQSQELTTEKQAHLAMLIQKEKIIKEIENPFKDQLEMANQEPIAEKQAHLELLDQKEKTLKESECNVPVFEKSSKMTTAAAAAAEAGAALVAAALTTENGFAGPVVNNILPGQPAQPLFRVNKKKL